MSNQNLSYPIGQFSIPDGYNVELITSSIATIAALPAEVQKRLDRLSAGQLEQAYRPAGWTVRQIIHHFADSHMNAFVRCKLATTEDWPAVKPYAENLWAEQPDHQLPVDLSLAILRGVHQRWTTLNQSLQTEDWLSRGYVHPEYGRQVPLWEIIPMYAWHCRHHLAHIDLVLEG